ncbi:MAG: protein-glutamate O-methyltransferase CheR [Sulfurimonas sp.]|uniref:CheR family methyltransferase n=1 Tax=Sulfurimonas sp. TaxID=2022749 RepID=UPI002627AF7B|nr:CheR family methyltransferase [Sulfurimonas sp.]MDD2652874.1 protein-glutamate O-methyltransferase CheR [Sulfurimonas sp.]MDD3452320.1 protein-glutamate O-methyltransferase CheR [Sulfurimonas sp.]
MFFDFFKKKEPYASRTEEHCVEEYNDVFLVANYFKNETGVTFDKHTSILKNKLITFCRQRNICSFGKLLEKVSFDKTLRQELIDALTTNETFFYREFRQIEEIVTLVKNSGERAEILCAPCATGEEPYSVAIALLEAGVAPSRFHILGIDINQDAIDKAKEARYKERNIKNLSQTILQRYFRQEDSVYILHESIKSQVSLKVFNLFDSAFKGIGKFDFILSRNMLIYFDKETKLKAREILESLRTNPKQEIFFGHADLF